MSLKNKPNDYDVVQISCGYKVAGENYNVWTKRGQVAEQVSLWLSKGLCDDVGRQFYLWHIATGAECSFPCMSQGSGGS